jgi:hypothetical protein
MARLIGRGYRGLRQVLRVTRHRAAVVMRVRVVLLVRATPAFSVRWAAGGPGGHAGHGRDQET